jgi:tRNA pseudouridine13 synthase
VEILGFEPAGEGGHSWIQVRKTGANSGWAAERLAKLWGIHPRHVGFAGSKDRHAVATQWFSLPGNAPPGLVDGTLLADGLEVLRLTRHDRKLRRGWLRGNRFELRVRDLQADEGRLAERFAAIAEGGMPNYFGDQRFGRRGGNLVSAREWLSGGPPPRRRAARSFALSAARAHIFNLVLGARVRARTWNLLESGDVARLDGSNSQFGVTVVDADLRRRVAEGDLHPSGPLWGAGDPGTSGAVRALEESIADSEPGLRLGLQAETRMDRRSLRVRVGDLSWTFGGDQLDLGFFLPAGCYATSVLEAALDVEDAAQATAARS